MQSHLLGLNIRVLAKFEMMKKGNFRKQMKKIITHKLLIVFFVSIFLLGCNKTPENEHPKISITVNWDSYNWLIDASTNCVVKYIGDSNFSLESCSIISNFYTQLFQKQGFNYPIPNTILEQEKNFYEQICRSINLYSFCSTELVESLNNIPYSSDFLNLSANEKIRIIVFAKTIIGASNGFCILLEEEEESKEQKPREAYTRSEGETRFERQLLNCLSYQIDGHLETTMGTILYISGMPQNFFYDVIVCGNEIFNGLWNHVN